MRIDPSAVMAVLMIAAAPGFGGPVQEQVVLEGPEGNPMHLPTEVLCLANGRCVVLDGANNRMAFFDGSGSFVWYLGREGVAPGEFLHPLGIDTSPEGDIVVSDTGNARLQVFDSSGRFLRALPLEAHSARPRPTGVAFDREDGRAFVADAGNHAVHVFRLPGYEPAGMLPLPVGPAELPAYPCSPVWHRGFLYLVEPLNGRIRRVDPESGAARFIGGFGAGPGRLYRPKGLAIDRAGKLHVSDSLQGMVSIFEPSGVFLGALGATGSDGRAFEHPFGVEISQEGRLAVVEMRKSRVAWARETVSAADTERMPSLSEEGDTREPPGDGDRTRPACTVCHPEWLPPEQVKGARRSGSSAGSHSMCLGCHDGPVADSRHTAFAPHSHFEGGRGVFDRLGLQGIPLGPEGEMTCMTCHKAHARAGDDYDMARTIFLRFPGPGGRICRICHGKMEREGNAHFMGPMDRPLPEALVRLGAAPPRGVQSRLDCRTCHLPHGRRDRSLLVGGERSTCALCHGQAGHGNEPHAMSGRFDCRECHRSHGGRPPGMLREKPGGAAAQCSRCHGAMDGVNESPHNPDRSGEACLFCHAPFAAPGGESFLWGRTPGPGETRIERQCRSCHAPDNVYAAPPVPLSRHPGGAVPMGIDGEDPDRLEVISCGTCHDAHGSAPSMLRPGTAEKACAACHGPEGLWRFLYYHQEGRRASGR